MLKLWSPGWTHFAYVYRIIDVYRGSKSHVLLLLFRQLRSMVNCHVLPIRWGFAVGPSSSLWFLQLEQELVGANRYVSKIGHLKKQIHNGLETKWPFQWGRIVSKPLWFFLGQPYIGILKKRGLPLIRLTSETIHKWLVFHKWTI